MAIENNHLIEFGEDLRAVREAYEEVREEKLEIDGLLATLLVTFHVSSDEYFEDIDPSQVASFLTLWDDGKKRRVNRSHLPEDAGDGVYVALSRWLSEVSETLRKDTGARPSFAAFCEILTAGLKRVYRHSAQPLAAIEAKVTKKKGTRPKAGDIIAIPHEGQRSFRGVFITKNTFGKAIGFFLGTHLGAIPSSEQHPEIFPHPLYTEDRPFKDGVWKVIGHDKGLLALFPEHPEKFVLPRHWPDEAWVQPFGGALTPTMDKRSLSKKEAGQLLIAEDVYSSPYMKQELEAVLPRYLLTDTDAAAR